MKQDIICPGPLTEEALTQAVEAFLMEVRPGRERLYDYYRSQKKVKKYCTNSLAGFCASCPLPKGDYLSRAA